MFSFPFLPHLLPLLFLQSRHSKLLNCCTFQFLCLWLACCCSCHVSFCINTPLLTIHISLTLSLPAQNLPLLQTFPTADFLPASFLVLCGRLSWLFVRFWAHVNIVYRIVSYRIVLCRILFQLKTYLFHKIFPPYKLCSFLRTDFTDFQTGRFFWTTVFFTSFNYLFCFFFGSVLFVARKTYFVVPHRTVSYRIVSFSCFSQDSLHGSRLWPDLLC